MRYDEILESKWEICELYITNTFDQGHAQCLTTTHVITFNSFTFLNFYRSTCQYQCRVHCPMFMLVFHYVRCKINKNLKHFMLIKVNSRCNDCNKHHNNYNVYNHCVRNRIRDRNLKPCYHVQVCCSTYDQ